MIVDPNAGYFGEKPTGRTIVPDDGVLLGQLRYADRFAGTAQRAVSG